MADLPGTTSAAPEVTLRGVRPEDAEAVTRLLEGDAGLALQTASLPIPYTIEDARAFLGSADPASVFAIAAGGELVGITGMTGAAEAVEIGYWVGRIHWGHGYATAAVRLLVAEAHRAGIARLFADVFPDNPASMRVLEKNGFARQGVIERDLPQRGGMRQLTRFCLP